MKKLPRAFYRHGTIDIAINLLGCEIVSNTDGIKTGGTIVETEAYIGLIDPASHAFRGMTNRNKVMFGPPGFLYVYFTYGNHFMMNVVTEKAGVSGAVLLRGLAPKYNIPEMARRRNTDDTNNIASGPGKLAKALGVAKVNYGTDLLGSHIYLRGPAEGDFEIIASPRVGIGEKGIENLWRFFIKDNPHVSSPDKAARANVFPLRQARDMGFTVR
jgi:DNA-3-methyladenine glycosylase